MLHFLFLRRQKVRVVIGLFVGGVKFICRKLCFFFFLFALRGEGGKVPCFSTLSWYYCISRGSCLRCAYKLCKTIFFARWLVERVVFRLFFRWTLFFRLWCAVVAGVMYRCGSSCVVVLALWVFEQYLWKGLVGSLGDFTV